MQAFDDSLGRGHNREPSFKATIDDHARFKDPRAAAHLGLTPRAYQSARSTHPAISASAVIS
ncbi:transposase [Bradyrhizobium elkanii]|uniref:transposase n=1 Tax=Bradyrhizobium elkanii TaxID=29448 RepID=UPI00114CA52C